MSDILKFIHSADAQRNDPDGNLLELEDWDETVAQSIAESQGITLTERHWDVIRFTRDHYRTFADADNARELLDAMEARFAPLGGRRFLYQLFPNGPVLTASRIAGVPVPEHTVDPSFGIAQ